MTACRSCSTGPEAEAAWLSGEVDVEGALEFLVPLENARVSVAPANPAVNKAGVEGDELLTPPAELTPPQTRCSDQRRWPPLYAPAPQLTTAR